jgi:hypothetical protein
MGSQKDEMMKTNDKREVAREIAARVGLLKKCETHEYYIDPLNDEAFESAYRLANSLISNNDPLVSIFRGDRHELTDFIKDVRSDVGLSCPGCDKWKDEND